MSARVTITLTPWALAPALPHFPEEGANGSILDFYGLVRGQEKEVTIPGLHYEAYEAMAKHQFALLTAELLIKYPVAEVEVMHRLGFVPTGEPSLHLRVKSVHRAEGLAFATEFLNRMKQDVPIWKRVDAFEIL